MVQLVLILGIFNVLLGYGLAALLAEPPLVGLADWNNWPQLWSRIRPGLHVDLPHETEVIGVLPPASGTSDSRSVFDGSAARPQLPAIAGADELPLAWRELLEAEQLAPRWFADGVAQGLRLQLAAYRQQALAAEARARLVLSQENSEGVEQLVADFRFLHHEWLGRLLEGAQLLRQRRSRLGAAEEAAGWLESTLYDHAARMEAIDRRISEINFKTDTVLGCRRLLAELLELMVGVHLLRDDLTAALAAIGREQQTLSELPHEQRLDSLTGRLNRLGLEAITCESALGEARQRQAILIALDSLRRVNERLGTRAGDRTLRAFSQLLADLLASTKASAEIVRWTGTRFLVLLDGISREQATGLAEQLRQSLEGATFDCQGTCFEMSARQGISAFEAGEALEPLLSRLETALDAAEIAGRNRCAVADAGGVRLVVPQIVAVINRRVVVGDGSELSSQATPSITAHDSQPLPVQQAETAVLAEEPSKSP